MRIFILLLFYSSSHDIPTQRASFKSNENATIINKQFKTDDNFDKNIQMEVHESIYPILYHL